MSKSDPLLLAYDPDHFRELGHRTVDLLADHLQSMRRREGLVLPWRSPEAMLGAWPASFRSEGDPDALLFFERILEEAIHLHHPRYIGHQVTAPLPKAALLAMVAELLNNASTVYEMGPTSTAMERRLAGWFAGLLGWDAAVSDGFLTHGGSAGNLTALLAARQHGAPFDVWEEGCREPERYCLLVSDQAHYSIRRSAQVMGLGGQSVVPIETDARYRMRVDALADTCRDVRAEGRTILAVVASAGSTATGSIDPLEAIADLCGEERLWLHVDAAHGGAAALSDRLRPSLRGIERADSVVVDAHKMMLLPAVITFVLFRDGKRSYETFAQQASYLFSGEERKEEWWDLAKRTLECTKRMLGFMVYGALRLHGTDLFAGYVERMYDQARRFAGHLASRPGWELATEPESNIVCFRFAPASVADPDAFQDRVRERIVHDGSFYLVRARLRGKTYLRCTIINPLTTDADLEALVALVESLA
jgi:L-2,4-diaminobutyrate decarboxylase